MAYPTDGRITSLAQFTGTLVGDELFTIVSPPDPNTGVNYKLSATTLASLIVISFPPQAANSVYAGPAAGPGTATPTFRGLVVADLPLGTTGLPLVGNGTSSTDFAVLSLAGGGLNTTTLTPFGVVYGNGTATVGITAAGTAGLPLVSNGTTAPAFAALGLSALPLGTVGLPIVGAGTAAPNYAVLTLVGGGFGTTTLTPFGVIYGNSTSTPGVTAAGGTGLAFVGNGGATAPGFAVLALPGGGFGTTTLTPFGVVYGNFTSTPGVTAAGAAALPLVANGTAAAPAFAVLTVPGGGSGTTALSNNGVVIANGSSAFGVIAAAAAGLVLTSNGTGSAPTFQPTSATSIAPQLVTAAGTVALATSIFRVLFTTASAGTSFVHMPDATLTGNPILIKDIKGNVSATAPLTISFTASQLADSLSTVSITVPFGAYWLNPLTIGTTGSWYITVA